MFRVEAMKVDFEAYLNGAALQVSKHAQLYAWAREEEVIVGFDIGLGDCRGRLFRRFFRARSRDGRRAASIRFDVLVPQALRVFNMLSKQLQLGLVDLFLHSRLECEAIRAMVRRRWKYISAHSRMGRDVRFAADWV